MHRKLFSDRRGVELILILTMSSVLLGLFTAALVLINAEQKMSRRTVERESVFSIAEAGINYYRWHLNHAPDDYVDGNIVSIRSIEPSGYHVNPTSVGTSYYSDSAETITALPSELETATWIMTRQADAGNTDGSFLTFDINRAAMTYIGYDQRGTPPDWLTSSFIDTGLTIETTDASASPLRVWKKQFPAGPVTLGGNSAAGSSGAGSMYTVAATATPGNGPFIHEYRDFNGTLIGEYSLTITPPAIGSTITTISSTGSLINDPDRKRTIIARFGVPSFSQYAVVAEEIMRFGEGTETFGRIHSNNGIRYDGVAHGLVTSSCPTYDDPDHAGANEPCVHTHQPDPSLVFLGGRDYPVAPVNFDGITGDLRTLKDSGQDPNGVYLGPGPSGSQGYHIVFKTNGTMDLYIVNTQDSCLYKPGSTWYSYANIFSIKTQSSFTYKGSSSLNVSLPSNGVIFVEDDVWVDGQINGSKITVVAAQEPLASGSASIIINNDLKYSSYDGTDVIGLIAQTDISAGFYSEDDLQIDAALIAQHGRVGRYYYRDYDLAPSRYNPSNCGGNLPNGYIQRTSLTLRGSIATHNRYGFAYTDGTGYINRNIIFDDHLIFGPPPSFPTTGEYTMINWQEQ